MFIAKNNDLIVLARETREELEQALQFMVYTSIEETDEEYELYGGSYLTKEEIRLKEQERIARLTMTALDFINVLKQAGLTAQQIKDYLDANIELDQQLKYCQNVYCGVVLQLCPLEIEDTGITLTAEDVIKAFKIKNGEVTNE